jgi:hypothetical protein
MTVARIAVLVQIFTMSVQELRKAYDELPETDQILFAALVAADQLTRQTEFAADLAQGHRAMDQGKKWTHADVLKLHGELEKQGL